MPGLRLALRAPRTVWARPATTPRHLNRDAGGFAFGRPTDEGRPLPHGVVDRIMARIPAWIGSGRSGQAAITSPRSGGWIEAARCPCAVTGAGCIRNLLLSSCLRDSSKGLRILRGSPPCGFESHRRQSLIETDSDRNLRRGADHLRPRTSLGRYMRRNALWSGGWLRPGSAPQSE